MKEIIAIIRPKKVGGTKDALEKLGFPSVTAIPVMGRGKQCGIAGEVSFDVSPEVLSLGKANKMKYIPKRMLSIVVNDSDVDLVIQSIVKINQTSEIGDGKIFICPVENAMRVRTNETGDSAII